MRPQKITVSAVAASNWIPVDYKQSPMNVGVACVVVSGTATYTVEYTFDDIFDPTVTPVAFALTAITAQTTSKEATINQPIMAVRLNVTAGTSPVVAMTLLQGQR